MKIVKLSDVYRVIAGHSDYHGDNILAALTCLAEGKEVSPVRPLKIKTGHWQWDPNGQDWDIGAWECSECGGLNLNIGLSEKIEPLQWMGSKFCPNCGVKMIKGQHLLSFFLDL